MKDKYEKLAIIGNGFDLKHGYKTSYYDFSNYIIKDVKAQNDVERLKEILKEKGLNDDKWYDFENQMKRVVSKYSYYDMSEMDNSHNMDEFNEINKKIRVYLTEYLKKEVDGRASKIESISRELEGNTLAINFNYTDTLLQYGCDTYYVHGSLKENNIVLGYDGYDDEAIEHAYYQHRMWLKDYRREQMEFIRYLIKKGIPFKLDEAREEIERIIEIQSSGKGLEEEDFLNLKYSLDIKNFINDTRIDDYTYSNLYQLNNINFSMIKSVVVIGHSIMSDHWYLNSILSKCKNIEEIKIFRRLNEKEERFKEKKELFIKYIDESKIQGVMY